MYLDYWHIRRYIRMQGTTADEDLPLSGPPFTVGNVVSLPEPVWQTIIATCRTYSTINFMDGWRWQNPLTPEQGRTFLEALEGTLEEISAGGTCKHPPDLAPEDRLDDETVIAAMNATRYLIALAVHRGKSIETWSE